MFREEMAVRRAKRYEGLRERIGRGVDEIESMKETGEREDRARCG
jgi:hypothetical protein